MNINNVIKEAVQQSQKTKYKYKLGAVIFNRHKIISGGYNRVHSINGIKQLGVCAESLAIKKAPAKLLKNTTILVCRVNKSGNLGMAKPCSKCKKAIAKAGIKKVIYSSPDGWKIMKM